MSRSPRTCRVFVPIGCAAVFETTLFSCGYESNSYQAGGQRVGGVIRIGAEERTECEPTVDKRTVVGPSRYNAHNDSAYVMRYDTQTDNVRQKKMTGSQHNLPHGNITEPGI